MKPVWILPDVALAVHESQLREHGGADGLRDAALLESALARPRNAYAYDPKVDLALLAALYAAGILKNHPFVDGNKRTGFVLCETFLELNGHRLEASDAECFRAVDGLASGAIGEAEFAAWLRTHMGARKRKPKG